MVSLGMWACNSLGVKGIMEIKRLRMSVTVAVLAALLVVSGCAPAVSPTAVPTRASVPTAGTTEPTKPPPPTVAPPSATATPRPATIKFGSPGFAAFTAFFLTLDKGYFKEQGIDIELVNFRSGSEGVAPLATGQLDILATSLATSILSAADRDMDIRLVAPASISAPSYEHNWILLRKDLADSGQVKTPAELKGMKIAVPSLGSLGDQTVQIMLEQAGLKPGDAEVIVIPVADQPVALANKAVAAAYTTEPTVAPIVQQGLAVKWKPASQFYGGQVQTTAMAFGLTLIKDQELGRRWTTAYLKGVREYLKALSPQGKREEVVQVLSKYTPVKDSKLYDLIETPYVDPNGQFHKASMDAQYKWYLEKGLYKGKKSFIDITDLSYVDYAVQKLGKQ